MRLDYFGSLESEWDYVLSFKSTPELFVSVLKLRNAPADFCLPLPDV